MLRTQTLAGEPIMELADFREQELVREVREQFHPMEEKKQLFSDQRDDPGIDVFKVFEVSDEDIQNIIDLLEQTSIKNKEISLQIKARLEKQKDKCII